MFINIDKAYEKVSREVIEDVWRLEVTDDLH